jgi:hypothetical protein
MKAYKISERGEFFDAKRLTDDTAYANTSKQNKATKMRAKRKRNKTQK